ncbi:HDL083Wp [Eremothecium sinecaudum]|uniref:HDL083Wp n=1 Tax=Eremothecium sinecaudum TaxID=45286 RepID=A0A0X8HSI9_9SACH|nr:HDL083Wp [Eremothecium sinecaudum]AMD20661.1 HDL083Wp [Eremothecium sinecaudum]
MRNEDNSKRPYGSQVNNRTILEQVGEYLSAHVQQQVEDKQSVPVDSKVNTGLDGVRLPRGEPYTNEQTSWSPDNILGLEEFDRSLLEVGNRELDAKPHVSVPGADLSTAVIDFSLLDENHVPEYEESDSRYHQGHSLDHGQAERYSSNQNLEDDIFSPMVSPMVAPWKSVSNTPFLNANTLHTTQNTPYLQTENKAAGAHLLKDKKTFSPLSSPALKAVKGCRSNSFSLPEASITSGKSRSKRTPHSTPYMAASSGKVVKQSPLVGPRKAPSPPRMKSSAWDDMLRLPGPSISTQSTQHYAASLGSASEGTPHSHSAVSTSSMGTGDEPQPMEEQQHSSSMVNFTQLILPSNNNTSRTSPPSDGKAIRATESAVFNARKYSVNADNDVNQPHSKANGNSKSNAYSAKNLQDPMLKKRDARSTTADNYQNDDEYTKKEVHKAAEQIRRNRLNNALLELNSLIPQEMKETVQIPSKATTVELACKYIKQLTGKER